VARTALKEDVGREEGREEGRERVDSSIKETWLMLATMLIRSDTREGSMASDIE